MPTWEEFCAIFEDPQFKNERELNAALISRHPGVLDQGHLDERHASVFCDAYDIQVDDSSGCLLEYFSTYLGADILSVEFDEQSDETKVNVRYAGQDYQLVDHVMGSDGFEDDMQCIEAMLAPGYAFRLPAQDGIGDCLNFILLPGDWWSRAERAYGAERVAEFFVKYGSPVGAEPAAAATTTAATNAAASATVAAEAIYLPRAPQAVMPAPRLRPNPWGVVLAVGLLALVLMRCYHHYEGIQQERAMQTACATGGPMFEAATKKLSSDEKASYLVTFRKQMGC